MTEHQPRPRYADLLRTEGQPWYHLVDPRGCTPALCGVSQEDGGLGSVEVRYRESLGSWARVGWHAARTPHPRLPPLAELRARDMEDQLVLAAAQIPGGEALTDRARMQQRLDDARAALTSWVATTLRIDGVDLPAWTASAFEDEIVFAMTDTRDVLCSPAAGTARGCCARARTSLIWPRWGTADRRVPAHDPAGPRADSVPGLIDTWPEVAEMAALLDALRLGDARVREAASRHLRERLEAPA
jgi:hypothetical protein